MIQTDLLHEHLENAISKLHLLITFTQEDIEDIKQAKHDSIFSRNNDKVCIIKEFEIAKNMIDKEMLTLTQNNPHLSLTDILDEKSNLLLSNMRKTLENLKKINTHYARMVFAVSEFYTSITDKLIPREKADYKSRVEQSQLLKAQA